MKAYSINQINGGLAILLLLWTITGCVGFIYGVMIGASDVNEAHKSVLHAPSVIVADKPPSDIQCVKYLFGDQNLSSVKRRVCGRGVNAESK